MASAEAIDHVIGRAYDCLIEPDRWNDLFTDFARAVGGDSGLLFVREKAGCGGLLASAGLGESYDIAKYYSYYEARSPLISFYRNAPEGSVLPLGDYAFSDNFRETEFYFDWVKPQGYGDMLGSHLMRNQQYSAWLSIRRAERRGIFTTSHVRDANRIAQHLNRVLNLRSKLDLEQGFSNELCRALDLVAFGVAVVDAAGKVLACNTLAEKILKAGDGLKLHRGHLTGERPHESSLLEGAIRAASHAMRSHCDVATDFRVHRRTTGHSLTLHVVPIRSAASWKGFAPPLGVAAIFIIDPHCGTIDIEGFANAYHLTQGERRVLGELVHGGGVVEAATRLALAVPTARTHLQHIFEKTNASSQAELVRLLMMCPLRPRN